MNAPRPARRALAGALAALLAGLALAPGAHGQSAPPVKGQVLSSKLVDGGSTPPLAGLLAEHDNFGHCVASVGDIDQDGISDLAVGAPGDDDGGHAPFVGDFGAVWILFLNATGGVKSVQKISSTAGNFQGALDPNDRFGWSITPIGDLDQDGRLDIGVGAPFDDDGGPDRGAIWLLFLNANGTVKTHRKISDEAGGFLGGLGDFDRFGMAMAVLGDMESDGSTEVAVGAQGDDNGGMFFDGPGAVWILSLLGQSSLIGFVKLSKSSGAFRGEIVDGDQFGTALAPLGDLNDDGVPDLGVGAPGDDTAGPDRGAFWIVLLRPSAEAEVATRVTQGQGGLSSVLTNFESFGSSLALGPDLDGDGRRELWVGSPLSPGSAGGSGGGFRVVSPSEDGVGDEALLVASGLGGFQSTLGFDHFGSGLGYVGDTDGDGRPELAVGAPFADGPGQNSGAIWLLEVHDNPFEIAGPGLAGAAGIPKLKPNGPLVPGSTIELDLSNAPPLTAALLFAGLTPIMAHFNGGILVPSPDLMFVHTTDGLGTVEFGGPWPPGLPGGITFYAQYWVLDPTGPLGWTASNAVKGLSLGPL